jgi:ABC-2 type transport system permease protein
MAPVTAPLAAPHRQRSRGRGDDLAGTLRSELTKLRSVRSTYWTLFILVLASIGWSVADCGGEASRWAAMTPQDRLGFDPTQASVAGLALLGQLILIVLGAITVTSEYSTGMIRTSLSVMPRRGVVYGAKVAAFTVVALVTAVVTSFAAFFVGQALLRGTHAAATLSGPNVARAVLGSALYVVLCGLFALGLGAILRNTAGAITAAYGFLFLVPILATALPGSWYADLERWLPGADVISAITSTGAQQGPHLFSAWGELAVFGAYTAILLVLGLLLFRRRDAG